MAKSKKYIFFTIGAMTFPLLRDSLMPLYYRPDDVKENRTAIVTGATGNLGYNIALGLAGHKARVIMACRDLDRCRAARREIVLVTGSKNIACRKLDLEDINSINEFVDDICKTEPHIDILINSAAVKDVPNKELTKYGIEKNYFVNFLGPLLLTMRLMSKLKESADITEDSRIVNVIGTPKKRWKVDLDDINFDKRKYNSRSAYEQSKLALAYATVLLEKMNREKESRIYVYGSSPVFWRNAKIVRRTDLWASLKNLKETVLGLPPGHAVGSTLYCALDKSMDNRESSGRLYSIFLASWELFWGLPKASDEDQAKRVWNHAMQTLLELPDQAKKAKSE